MSTSRSAFGLKNLPLCAKESKAKVLLSNHANGREWKSSHYHRVGLFVFWLSVHRLCGCSCSCVSAWVTHVCIVVSCPSQRAFFPSSSVAGLTLHSGAGLTWLLTRVNSSKVTASYQLSREKKPPKQHKHTHMDAQLNFNMATYLCTDGNQVSKSRESNQVLW